MKLKKYLQLNMILLATAIVLLAAGLIWQIVSSSNLATEGIDTADNGDAAAADNGETDADAGTGFAPLLSGQVAEDGLDSEAAAEQQRQQALEKANLEFILQQIEAQPTIEQNILAEMAGFSYTAEEPLILLNPYGISPLSALIAFKTDIPLKISLQISGKDEHSGLSFEFDFFNNEHYLPIYGLYAQHANTINLSGHDSEGNLIIEQTYTIQTDPLTAPYNTYIIQAETYDQNAYQEGFNFTTQYIKSAYDANGEFRWYLPRHFLLGSTYELANGHMLLGVGATHQGDTIFVEMNYLGKIFAAYYAPYGSHHHLEMLPNGNFLVAGSSGYTVEDIVYEMDPQTGQIANIIDYKQILQRTRLLPNLSYQQNRDWLHLNALSYQEQSNSLIISSNMQSAVIKHDYDDLSIDWILGDPVGWSNMYQQYLLEPIGENFEYSYGQHLPLVLDDLDNNPDTVDILLFDNGRGRYSFDSELMYAIEQGQIMPPESYSRMVHYRIDEANMTVEQIWQYGKEAGVDLYSIWGGSSYYLDNGNRLGLFSVSTEGETIYYPHALEVDEAGNIIWEAMFFTDGPHGNFGENRLQRMNIYNQSANDLGIGRPLNDMITDNIWQKYGF